MGLNHSEAINRIVRLSQRDLSTQQTKKELFSILSITDKGEYDKVVTGVVDFYKNAKGYDERRRLQVISPIVASYTTENRGEGKTDKKEPGGKPGVVTLIREKDSTGKYKVYKYQVKNRGYPKHIIKQYARQTKRGSEGVKITNSKGKEYPKDKKFSAGDTVYIKVPINSKELNKSIEHIEIQENYIKGQSESEKQMLENFNQQHPMGKDVKMTFGFPVKSYEDIEKTLTGLTTKQIGVKPEEYEVVILLNRPNKEAEFSKDTKEKILKFKKEHPIYNIHIFEKTFNFGKDKNGKTKVNFGEIYKTLGDTIVYRNLQRKNIKGMDPKKIENLIIKTGAADSTDKNPRYIANQFEKYSHTYGGKELIRLTGESRLPANICKTYPLIELSEFFQRHFDAEYVGGAINRTVGIGSYKSWMYCDAKGFDPTCHKGEDVNFIKRIRARTKDNKNIKNVAMHYDEGFIGAIDESCDRGIWAMVEKNIPYCDRYNNNEGDFASKEKNRNTYAIKHKGEEKFKVLELTKQNLEKNISALYTQKINNIFTGKMGSRKYRGRNDEKGNHHPGYLDSEEGKKATPQEKFERIAKNIGNPIVEKVLSRKDFMGLSKGDYSFGPIEIESYKDNKNKIKYRVKSYPIRFNNIAITKIQTIHNQKIKNGYYNYR